MADQVAPEPLMLALPLAEPSAAWLCVCSIGSVLVAVQSICLYVSSIQHGMVSGS